MTVTMLYNDPHPVHERMAAEIDAELVQADHGGPLSRISSAASGDFEGPVILEGGVPLIEGAALKCLRRADPVIMLAADETLLNLERRLPYYTEAETYAHRAASKLIDGVIAVSDDLADAAQGVLGVPTVVANPFVLEPLGSKLDECEPSLDGQTVLCVGENRPAFNQSALVKACNDDFDLVFAGRNTQSLKGGEGYVTEDRLVELYEQADLFVMPALAGAFPVSAIEAMRAGVPAIVTNRCGNWRLVHSVDPWLVTRPKADGMRINLEWYMDLSVEERRSLGSVARRTAQPFDEREGAKRFAEAYRELVAKL